MTTLIAMLSVGKGTWAEVIRLINSEDWEKVLLITNDFGRDKFSSPKAEQTELLVVDSRKPERDLCKDMKAQLEGKINGAEVALNLTSGTGKEHMALIQAVLNLGFGLRLVTVENDQMVVIE